MVLLQQQRIFFGYEKYKIHNCIDKQWKSTYFYTLEYICVFGKKNIFWFFSILLPQFWTRIINILKIDEHDIAQARRILSLLGYNNLAAISKLTKPHAISCLELEFQKKKENTNFDEQLRPVSFGSGTSITIAEIARAALKCLKAEEHPDNDKMAIKTSIIEKCKKVICLSTIEVFPFSIKFVFPF